MNCSCKSWICSCISWGILNERNIQLSYISVNSEECKKLLVLSLINMANLRGLRWSQIDFSLLKSVNGILITPVQRRYSIKHTIIHNLLHSHQRALPISHIKILPDCFLAAAQLINSPTCLLTDSTSHWAYGASLACVVLSNSSRVSRLCARY